MSSARTPYWCYQCSHIVSLPRNLDLTCPDCHGEFVEEIPGSGVESGLLETPAALLFAQSRFFAGEGPERRRGGLLVRGDGYRRGWHRRNAIDGRTPFDQILYAMSDMMSPHHGRPTAPEWDWLNSGDVRADHQDAEGVPFSLPDRLHSVLIRRQENARTLGQIDEDGVGSRRFVDVRDFFLGPGLDQLIQQLAERDGGRYGTAPALKSAVEALPTLKITKQNMESDHAHCAVCMEMFEVGGEVRQMPCKHIYHSDCILPWLALHSSCPVCRHEMPTEDPNESQSVNSQRTSLGNPPPRGRVEDDSGRGGRGIAVLGIPGLGIHVRAFTLWDVGRSEEAERENDASTSASVAEASSTGSSSSELDTALGASSASDTRERSDAGTSAARRTFLRIPREHASRHSGRGNFFSWLFRSWNASSSHGNSRSDQANDAGNPSRISNAGGRWFRRFN